MFNNKNYVRNPMQCSADCNSTSKMDLKKFVGMDSSCNENIDAMDGMVIGMCYVPWQQWRNIYEPKEGFKRGTIFQELDKPFEAAKGCR